MQTDWEKFLVGELGHYGVPPEAVRLFGDGASPDLINYLDLVEGHRPGLDGSADLKPDGVAEVEGRPLLFFVKESGLVSTPAESDVRFTNLLRGLACRGDEVYLARIRPGEILVDKVDIRAKQPSWRPYVAGTPDAETFFTSLAHGTLKGEKRSKFISVFDEMLELLINAANQLATKVSRNNVLSLVGRALFFRFLSDRAIIGPNDLPRICPTAFELRECFSNADNARLTSAWLDRTFNGHFLPLGDDSDAFFSYLNGAFKSAFTHLASIVQGWKPLGSDYQLKLGWADFDFAHVPVGLLSQIYEAFCWKWSQDTAKGTSMHYTPRHIAEILVDEAFDGLPNAHEAKVLDCACGAGVFLVLAFRRLYRERWRAKGYRPETKEIREILEKQLAGFDISEAALRLAALSLYLTAIELDPTPIPPEKLRFKELTGLVLFNHRGNDPEDVPVLGSLGVHVSKKFNGRFDLVLSNPPWTSFPKKFRKPLTNVCLDVFANADAMTLATMYENPDVEPDLPFVFKATEWCKLGGRIAMALPARILLKQADIPRRAREVLFKWVQVTGIINGSNLADTNIWPGMSQPFMLLFARNERPKSDYAVRFITPQYDVGIRNTNYMAIDSKSAQRLLVSESFKFPWFWKAHAIGTALDVEVVRRFTESDAIHLAEYWGKKKLKLKSGKGFQIAGKQEQRPATFMRKYPELADTDKFRFIVDTSELEKSKRNSACWPRKEEIYKGPLVLVKESPGDDRTSGWALLCLEDVLYNESFCGFSAANHAQGELLSRYLHLFVHSSIWMHYALMTSPKFGAERRRIYKEDLEACPIVPLERLSGRQKESVWRLSRRLISGDVRVFKLIDVFFANLHGLDKLDREVIRDTLEVCTPYGTARSRAWKSPTTAERQTFINRLAAVLSPFFEVLGKRPNVTEFDMGEITGSIPYQSLIISIAGRRTPSLTLPPLAMALDLALNTGATRVIQSLEGGIAISILNQYRYWTPSRARLLGAEIIRHHMSILEG